MKEGTKAYFSKVCYKVSILFVSLAIVTLLMPLQVDAATSTGTLGDHGGITWTLDSDTMILTLTGEDSGLQGERLFDVGMSQFSNIMVEKIIVKDCKIIGDASYMFAAFNRLKEIEFINVDTSEVTNMEGMFYWIPEIKSLDLSSFDTSKVTDMSNMFSRCVSLEELKISVFRTPQVTSMHHMFDDCRELMDFQVENFDTSKVTDMSYMFTHCEKVTDLNLSSFNTSKVTNMECMFDQCWKLEELNIRSFEILSETDTTDMFNGCGKLKSILAPSKIGDSQSIVLPYQFYVNDDCVEKITSKEANKQLTKIRLYKPFEGATYGLTYEYEEDGIKITGFMGSADGQKLVIPEKINGTTVKCIGERAFEYAGFIGELNIPQGVKVIGKYAFAYCKGLSGSLMIPDSVEKIDKSAFWGCEGFDKNIYLSANLKGVVGPEALVILSVENGINLRYDLTQITIHAPKGSYAESYAKDRNYSYAEWGEPVEAFKSEPETTIRVKDVRDSSKISEIALDTSGTIMGDGDYHIYIWFNPNYMCEETYGYLVGPYHFMQKIGENYPVTVFVERKESGNGWMLQELEKRSSVISKDVFTIVDVTNDDGFYRDIMYNMASYIQWDIYASEYVAFVVSPNGKYKGVSQCNPERDKRSPELVSLSLGTAFSMAGRGNWYSATEIEVEDKPLTFTDVKKGEWQYPFVKYIVHNGVMSGKKVDADGVITFDPNVNMTRAEFVQALYSKEGKPTVTYTNRFKDVENGKWYTDATLWAAANSIVSGTGVGGEYFDVNGNITREQVATILYNYAKNFKGVDTEGRAEDEFQEFTDKGNTSNWAVDNIQWALHYNIMKGKGELLDPTGFATRAECATMLKSFMFQYE